MDQPLPMYEGPDRIDFSRALGRPLRQGSWEELAVPDADRARKALEAGDIPKAMNHLHYLLGVGAATVGTGFEWLLNLVAFVAREGSPEAAAEAAAEAGRACAALVEADTGAAREMGEAVLKALGASPLTGDSIAEFRRQVQAGESTLAAPVLDPLSRRFGLLTSALVDERQSEALALFDDLLERIRAAHDAQIRFAWAYVHQMDRRLGQDFAERGQHEALAACGFYRQSWKVSARLSPPEVAAMLADQMRAHFTGPGRGGGVLVVEEEDRYRLVFDPCGTGQAQRRAGLADRPEFGCFQGASPGTWGLEGVPIQCAQCAQVELDSVRRLGHLQFVTEYDPDPEKPCGWTVYKDPASIPRRYLERLGL